MPAPTSEVPPAPGFQGCRGDPWKALVASECPAGRCGFRYHPGPKQDLPLRTRGTDTKTANVNQGSTSSEDHPIQYKAVLSPQSELSVRMSLKPATTQAYKLSHFANAENGTEKKGILSGICKPWCSLLGS